jgi:hypothetical protein
MIWLVNLLLQGISYVIQSLETVHLKERVNLMPYKSGGYPQRLPIKKLPVPKAVVVPKAIPMTPAVAPPILTPQQSLKQFATKPVVKPPKPPTRAATKALTKPLKTYLP